MIKAVFRRKFAHGAERNAPVRLGLSQKLDFPRVFDALSKVS